MQWLRLETEGFVQFPSGRVLEQGHLLFPLTAPHRPWFLWVSVCFTSLCVHCVVCVFHSFLQRPTGSGSQKWMQCIFKCIYVITSMQLYSIIKRISNGVERVWGKKAKEYAIMLVSFVHFNWTCGCVVVTRTNQTYKTSGRVIGWWRWIPQPNRHLERDHTFRLEGKLTPFKPPDIFAKNSKIIV